MRGGVLVCTVQIYLLGGEQGAAQYMVEFLRGQVGGVSVVLISGVVASKRWLCLADRGSGESAAAAVAATVGCRRCHTLWTDFRKLDYFVATISDGAEK